MPGSSPVEPSPVESSPAETTSSRPKRLDHRALVSGIAAATLPPDDFGHREHVQLAWIYLRERPLLGALRAVCDAIEGFAVANGAPAKFHATVTWAYTLLIAERLRDAPRDEDFDTFLARNPELLRHRPSVLDAWYSPACLASETARAGVVLPDRRG